MEINIGDRVKWSVYLMCHRDYSAIDEIVDVDHFEGTVLEICGVHSEIAIPHALVKLDDDRQQYINLFELTKV